MPIPECLRDPPQIAALRRDESHPNAGTLLLCRRLVGFAGIALATLALLFQCYQYLSSGAYLDHIEGNVVISGWQYVHGTPLYETQDGTPRLSTYYGPLAYLAEIPALLLFGANVTASKLTSMLALLGTVVLMSAYFIRHPGSKEARHGIFLLVAALLLFSPMSFWVRPDPIETLLVAAAIVSTASRRHPLWRRICK